MLCTGAGRPGLPTLPATGGGEAGRHVEPPAVGGGAMPTEVDAILAGYEITATGDHPVVIRYGGFTIGHITAYEMRQQVPHVQWAPGWLVSGGAISWALGRAVVAKVRASTEGRSPGPEIPTGAPLDRRSPILQIHPRWPPLSVPPAVASRPSWPHWAGRSPRRPAPKPPMRDGASSTHTERWPRGGAVNRTCDSSTPSFSDSEKDEPYPSWVCAAT